MVETGTTGKKLLKTSLFYLAVVGGWLAIPVFVKLSPLDVLVYLAGAAVLVGVALVDLVKALKEASLEVLPLYLSDGCTWRDVIAGRCIPRQYAFIYRGAWEVYERITTIATVVVVVVVVAALLLAAWAMYHSITAKAADITAKINEALNTALGHG